MLTPVEKDLRRLACRIARCVESPHYSVEYFAAELVTTLDRLDATREDLALLGDLRGASCGKPSKAARSATARRSSSERT